MCHLRRISWVDVYSLLYVYLRVLRSQQVIQYGGLTIHHVHRVGHVLHIGRLASHVKRVLVSITVSTTTRIRVCSRRTILIRVVLGRYGGFGK